MRAGRIERGTGILGIPEHVREDNRLISGNARPECRPASFKRGILVRHAILRAMAEDLGSREICARVKISLRMLRFHMQMLYQISDAATVYGLMMWAARKRLVK